MSTQDLPGETSAPLNPAQCAHGRMRCELEDGHTGQHRRGKYDWNNHETDPMKLVIIESPYAGDVELNETYARRCMADSLARGEAPLASHLLYTQPGILDDTDHLQREQGIAAGLAWGTHADLTAVYTDRGITPGMVHGINRAEKQSRPVEYRSIGEPPPPTDECPHCHGTGQHILRVKRNKGETEYIHDGVQCPHCKGTGDTP